MPLVEATPDHPVRVEVSNGIGTLTMHRPEARNAINPAMRRALRSSLAKFEASDDVQVMILTGTDPAFTAGLDLKMIGDDRTSLLSETPVGSSNPFPVSD